MDALILVIPSWLLDVSLLKIPIIVIIRERKGGQGMSLLQVQLLQHCQYTLITCLNVQITQVWQGLDGTPEGGCTTSILKHHLHGTANVRSGSIVLKK
ncbi:hypothetical protein ACYZUD_27650 [Pseudomonas sp. XS1P51]